MNENLHISDRAVGPGRPPYVIAEVGVNHDGDPARAIELTDAAADAGAHAVKLQFFETDRLMSKAAKLAAYQKVAGETDPLEMLRRLELPIDEMAAVIDRAHARGIHAIVTVFSVELVERAAALPWDAFKTASPDLINRPLLEAIAAQGRPMIVSTGAAYLDEVARAAEWLEGARERLAMLQCVSSYPAPDASLGGIRAIAAATGLPTGYSDHTNSIETGAEAVRSGACILEKHLTYDTTAAGPDHAASLDPAGMARYAELVAHAATEPAVTPEGGKRVLACERDVRTVSRQSLVAVRALPTGHQIRRDDLTIKRPGTGLAPFRLGDAVGATTARAVEADTPLVESDLSG